MIGLVQSFGDDPEPEKLCRTPQPIECDVTQRAAVTDDDPQDSLCSHRTNVPCG